jgi:DNA-binding NarL/FixJ family response regulator
MKTIRVLVVDDHAIVRAGLRAVLESAGDMLVVGEADNGEMAIKTAHVLQPDLVLLDLCMPRLDGVSALREIARVAPNAKVVVVSGMSPTAVAPFLDAGAVGYVPKMIAPFEFLERMKEILGAHEPKTDRDGFDAGSHPLVSSIT